MRFSKKVVAVALCAALVPAAAPARAAVEEQNRQVGVTGERVDEWDPAINATIRPDGTGEFTYNNPESAVEVHKFSLSAGVSIDGAKVRTDWNAVPTTTTNDREDTVAYTQTVDGVVITREFRVKDNRVAMSVSARNDGSDSANVLIDAVSGLTGANLSATKVGYRSWRVQPEERGYITTVSFNGANGSGTGATAADALGNAGSNPRYQAGQWYRTLQPGEGFVAKSTIDVDTQPSALDSDGDGLRDSWEANGMTLADGTTLPIHKWGADEGKRDLFLQLNWMKSEWETLGCERTKRFDATVEDFTKFAECARANVKDYTPSPEILNDLEDRFASKDVNLHIDAGRSYVSSSMSSLAVQDRKGGKTEDYRAEYLPELDGLDDLQYSLRAQELLEPKRDQLLGERKSAFRVGVIGDRITAGDPSTGIALVNDSIFFVANHAGMTTQEQLRNTILHEFGHTLNLMHYGPHVAGNTAPREDDLDWYNSVMSYAHQFTLPNYAERDSNKDGKHIPADWANLNFAGANVGKGSVSVGVGEEQKRDDNTAPDKAPDVIGEIDVDTLVENAAKDNDRKAGFEVEKTLNGDNGVVTRLGDDNILRAKISNLGSVPETYKVSVNYGTGVFQDTYQLAPAGQAGNTRKVNIQLDRAAFIDTPVVPVSVVVTNSRGDEVFTETYKVSALNYTDEEMEKVRREVLASDADAYVKDLARKKLQPKTRTGTTATAAPAAPAQAQGSSASPLAVIFGVLLALGGIGAAAYGWALNQGLI